MLDTIFYSIEMFNLAKSLFNTAKSVYSIYLIYDRYKNNRRVHSK